MLLKLSNIYAGYDGGDVLKGIGLTEQGTTTCIVGPNGAGNSTVLRVLSGLLNHGWAKFSLMVALLLA